MSALRPIRQILATALAACLMALAAMPAYAAPSAADVSADRTAVDRAVREYADAQAKADDVAARIADASAELDRLVAEEQAARDTLTSRAEAIYRTPDDGVITVLLEASSIQDFVARWDFLTRIARQDADTLAAIEAAQAKAERSAAALMDLQAEQARALDATSKEVASAKQELASSQSALAEYQSRTVEKPEPKLTPSTHKTTPKLTGTGAWKTAVASHYGRNFTGRGASGEEIGPYSMIVAHRTLPFGTLIEFEYKGKTAVARVADRGPHVEGREFDLGPGVVRVLDFSGVDEVRYRIISQ